MYRLCSNVQNLSIYVIGLGLENCVHSWFICYRNEILFFFCIVFDAVWSRQAQSIHSIGKRKEERIQLNQLRAFC